MNKYELAALLSLAMSPDPANWKLFHCYPLEDKLAALELFWNEVIYSKWQLTDRTVKRGSCSDPYRSVIICTKMPFNSIYITEYSNEWISCGLICEIIGANRTTSLKTLKCVFINYVTKHHE